MAEEAEKHAAVAEEHERAFLESPHRQPSATHGNIQAEIQLQESQEALHVLGAETAAVSLASGCQHPQHWRRRGRQRDK
jgi:hypothetical protein